MSDCNECGMLEDEVVRLRAEVERLHGLYLDEIDKSIAAEARVARLETIRKDQVWVIERIATELKEAGIELQWADGGGNKAPSGWHRNPYINVGTRESWKLRLDAAERARDEALRILAVVDDIGLYLGDKVQAAVNRILENK